MNVIRAKINNFAIPTFYKSISKINFSLFTTLIFFIYGCSSSSETSVLENIQKNNEKRIGILYENREEVEFEWSEVGNIDLQGKYEGEIENGVPSGIGKIIYPNGEEYKGGWENGAKHGKGVANFPNGEIYNGKWKNGKMNGYGTYTFPNG